MRLKTVIGESSKRQTCAANVMEVTAFYDAGRICPNVIETCGSKMSKFTSDEVYSLSAAHTHGSLGTFNPSLILKIFFFRQSWYFQFVGIYQIHASLQRDVTFLGRSVPGRMLETYILENDIMHRTFEGAIDIDDCLKHGGCE